MALVSSIPLDDDDDDDDGGLAWTTRAQCCIYFKQGNAQQNGQVRGCRCIRIEFNKMEKCDCKHDTGFN